MKIGIIGAGAFGTALACAIARNGTQVVILDRDEERAEMIESSRQTARLPGVQLGAGIRVTSNVAELEPCLALLLAIPMQHLRSTLDRHNDLLGNRPLVACCKGIELTTGLGPVDILIAIRPAQPAAILTGPSFAADIARGLPTALTLATTSDRDATALQNLLSAPALRIYRSTDIVGAQLGGALKNVVAIGCGAVMGAGLGESARAALMTRGFAEMARITEAMGGDSATLAGLAGFGDLALTCTSVKSRNYRFGVALGKGLSFDTSVTVEGAPTARAMRAKAQAQGIDTPITDAVVALLDGKATVPQMVEHLLSRPLRSET